MMEDIKKELDEEKLDQATGGRSQLPLRKTNDICPNCGKEIFREILLRITDQTGAKPTYWCNTCHLKWLKEEYPVNEAAPYKLLKQDDDGTFGISEKRFGSYKKTI